MRNYLVQRLGADDNGADCYRWRASENATVVGQGTADALRAAVGAAPITLVLAGSDVVQTRLQLSRAEQRHFHELAAFELEDRVLGAPEGIHVARGASRGDACLVVYTDRQALGTQLDALATLGLEVSACLPLPALLPQCEGGWSLALEDDVIHVRCDSDRFVTLPLELASRALQALLDVESEPRVLELYAANARELQQLEQVLDAASATLAASQRVCHAGTPLWSTLEAASSASCDLRQGAFARRLPLQRWWRQSRGAVALLAFAFLAWTALQLLQIRQLDAQYRAIEARSSDVYREVVPDGVLVNAEQQLAAQVARLEGGSSEGVLILLSQLAPLLDESGGLLITRLDYNAPRGELQLSLSAARNGDILAFTDALQAQGLQAQAQGFSRQGQVQLANVLIRELNE